MKNVVEMCEVLGVKCKQVKKERFERDYIVTFTNGYQCYIYVVEPCNVLGYRTFRVRTLKDGNHHFIDLFGDGSTTITYKKLWAILTLMKEKADENESIK